MTEQVHYSVSAFKDASMCSARLYYKQMVREKRAEEDPCYPATYGSAAHHAIEMRLKGLSTNPYVTAYEFIQENLLDKFKPELLEQDSILQMNQQITRCIDNFENLHYREIVEQLTDPEHQVELGLEFPWRKGIFRGKVDVALPEVWGDWKTGKKVPSQVEVINDPQYMMYKYLGGLTGLQVPDTFKYIYLYGQNVALKRTMLKSGPNKGEIRYVEDKENPTWLTHRTVISTDSLIERKVTNWAIPMARLMEEKIYAKQPSKYNCGSCKYRTVCDQTDMPTMSEAEHVDLIKGFQAKDAVQG